MSFKVWRNVCLLLKSSDLGSIVAKDQSCASLSESVSRGAAIMAANSGHNGPQSSMIGLNHLQPMPMSSQMSRSQELNYVEGMRFDYVLNAIDGWSPFSPSMTSTESAPNGSSESHAERDD